MLIGLGGTIRNLARIEGRRRDYPLGQFHSFTLTKAAIEESIDLFRSMPLAKRQRIIGLNEDRADIILPGALVIRAIMERLEMEQLSFSHYGIREGLFFEQFWSHLLYPVISDVRRFSVLNLARIYAYHKGHANHVRYLAGRLFEQMAPLHGYDRQARELLDAAALLHDIGTIIDYESHHKHTETLIINRGLPGFSPREQAIVALLGRYHRRGTPNGREYHTLLGDDDLVMVTRLSALLRMAEYLERGRNATIHDVTARWDDDQTLHLTVASDDYPHVELWQTQHKAIPLMETAFDRQVVMHTIAAPT